MLICFYCANTILGGKILNITTSCGENKKEIIEFKSGTLWKEKEYKQIKVNNITLIGKYNFNNMAKNFYGQFFDELEDINKNKITLIVNEDMRKNLQDGEFYEIKGKLTTHPDTYSMKVKLYTRLELEEAFLIANKKDFPKLKVALDRKKSLLELKSEKNKQTENWLYQKLEKDEKVNFLVITSLKGYNGTTETDILNDIYETEGDKDKLKKYFGFSSTRDENILRVTFLDHNIILEIKKKIEESKKQGHIYDYLVFIKGGGSKMKLFDNLDFCNEVVNLNIPFITAVGHSDDNIRLLCELADINYKVPLQFGSKLIGKINFINYKKEKIFNEFDKKEKVSKLESEKNLLNQNIKDLKKDLEKKDIEIQQIENKNKLLNDKLNKKEESIESLKDIFKKLKDEKNKKIETLETEKKDIEKKVNGRDFLLIIAFILILFLTGYLVYSNFFKNTKEIKKDSLAITNIKIEKDLIKPKVKDEKTKKEAIQKKLIYSEDEVFTSLLWKGYKGERAIYDFQKANKMKQTGKVDEALLKKLGIKIRYK